MDNLNPMDVLKEEMESEELSVRVNAMHRIRVISTLLGVEGTKNQLIPYFEQIVKKEDDEVVFALAQEIKHIAQILSNYQLILLPLFEYLMGYEETVVREQSLKSLIAVCQQISDSEVVNHIIPMSFRLCQNDQNFSCRVSAVNLMCPLYPRAGNQKEKIRQKFTELSNEETPMVRRAIAVKIAEICQFMDKQHVIQDLIPIQKQLQQDEQDQVRLLCMEGLKNIAKVFFKDENKTHLLPLIIQAAEDKSWRVRVALSRIFGELAEGVGKEITDSSLIQIFVNLLKDVEGDVRMTAVQSIKFFIKCCSPEKLQLLIPSVQNLGKDQSNVVRSKVGEAIGILSTAFPKDVNVQKLVPVLQGLITDENQEVRMNASRSVGKITDSIGVENLSLFQTQLKQAVDDPKWRVRKETMNSIITIIQGCSNYDIFLKFLEPLFLNYLKDRATEVRDLGVIKLASIAEKYKPEWIHQNLLPKLNENLQKDKGYLFRITALKSLMSICQILNGDQINEKILPILLKNAKDNVANVRFNTIRVLKAIQPKITNGQSLNSIKQIFSELSEDQDKDVKFFATEALR